LRSTYHFPMFVNVPDPYAPIVFSQCAKGLWRVVVGKRR
jgi:hypothetical protein